MKFRKTKVKYQKLLNAFWAILCPFLKIVFSSVSVTVLLTLLVPPPKKVIRSKQVESNNNSSSLMFALV